ncbi:conserved hypothetical protein [Actinacidiphila cocklensis]|uniref:Uncharacterized protein n=1 Tax=Actinacidiphila cocklensis TaxID=887465 RepID=A0A9W4DRQ3_9ACTN|nr:conserved hypothetical protein [Actinacidiphila cocklensis]
MIGSPHAEDWFVWGIHCTESPHVPGGWHLVVEFPAVKEMIDLLARGWVTGEELQYALDAFAQRFHTAEELSSAFDAGLSGAFGTGVGSAFDAGVGRPFDVEPSGPFDVEPSSAVDPGQIGDDCPHACPVCLGARAEFDAISIESFTHKVRLSDQDRHPYAAGKNTLHRSYCPKVAQFVGRAEPVEPPWCLAALPAFAHHGVLSTSWAAGMQVMTVEEATEWVGRKTAAPAGTGYKKCRHCLSPVLGTEAGANGEGVPAAGYWSAGSPATW